MVGTPAETRWWEYREKKNTSQILTCILMVLLRGLKQKKGTVDVTRLESTNVLYFYRYTKKCIYK
jgi:hypothetical protein